MSKKRNIFVTSDCWLGRINIIDLNNRPFNSIQEMDTKIIERWNDVVNENDVVVILGNFIWDTNYYVEYLMKMAGIKILLPTLTDRASIIANTAILHSQDRFFSTHTTKNKIDYTNILNLGNFDNILENIHNIEKSEYGFMVTKSNVMECPKHNIILSTYPLLNWTGKEDGVINVHGYNTMDNNDWCRFNVNMEMNDYKPIPLDILIKTITSFKTSQQ